jgi:hypothetical protein
MENIKIGSMVRIKPNLKEGALYGGYTIPHDTIAHLGKTTTVVDIEDNSFLLKCNYSYYTQEMIELIS